MKVNIIYELNNREYNNCVLLQRELIRRGHDARIYNKTEDMLFADNTKSITVIPNSYRKEDLDHYRYVFNTNNGTIIIYPCEQVTNHKLPAFFDYSDNNPVKNLPVLCWGKDYFDFISKLGFKNKDNAIVGAVQLDFFRREFETINETREQLSNKYQIPFNKKWILFVSDFVFNSEIIVEQIVNSGDQAEDVIKSKHEFGKKTCEKLLEWFEVFLNEQEDYIIIYRKHPVELLTREIQNFERRNKGRFFTISDLNIREWIANCDRLACWYSTTVVECVAANKNMVLLRPYMMEESSGFNDYEFFKHYYKVTEYDQFKDAMLRNKNEYTSETLKVIDRLYSIDMNPSFKRVADVLEKIEQTKKNNLRDPEKYFKIKRWRYLLCNLIPLKIILKKM